MSEELAKKIRGKQTYLRKLERMQTDPEYRKKYLADMKAYYHRTKKTQIKTSIQWNKDHREQKNASNRAYYMRKKSRKK